MNNVWKPHATVAAIIADQGRYLLVEEQTRNGLKLNQPAGHLEAGESPLEAVVREVLEESARSFVPQGLLGVYLSRTRLNGGGDDTTADITYLRMAFVGTVGDVIAGWALDHGIVGTHWLTLDEIRASTDRHRSPLLLRCVEDHASGKALMPLESIYTDGSIYL